MAHIGHPTVSDGKYTDSAIYQSDRAWCRRNFIHRYHLAFKDGEGTGRHATSPLPMDLAHALGHLSAHDAESAVALQRWLDGSIPLDWDEYQVLRGHTEKGHPTKPRRSTAGISNDWTNNYRHLE